MALRPAGTRVLAVAVVDDPASECDESKLLIHMPDGTVRYRERNSVDPAGINGGVDNDTFLGNAGDDDAIEAGPGADNVVPR